jgi:hypothetical protein
MSTNRYGFPDIGAALHADRGANSSSGIESDAKYDVGAKQEAVAVARRYKKVERWERRVVNLGDWRTGEMVEGARTCLNVVAILLPWFVSAGRR